MDTDHVPLLLGITGTTLRRKGLLQMETSRFETRVGVSQDQPYSGARPTSRIYISALSTYLTAMQFIAPGKLIPRSRVFAFHYQCELLLLPLQNYLFPFLLPLF